MEKPTWSPEKLATWNTGRGFLLCLVVLSLLGGAAWIFLIKGLYLLPEEMCDGTLKRSMVTQLLPQARSAKDGSDRRGTGDDFSFSCYVTTSNDSSISGQVDIRPISKDEWVKNYQGDGEDHSTVRISAKGVEAVAQLNADSPAAGVYVSCIPPVIPSYNASKPYAVVTEVTVAGDTKATGSGLRQALTDIAYRLTKHAYELAECKDSHHFPEDLPRYH
ncbi:hypothetical protein ACFYO5_31685 [Streptomyces sp. NPDC006259]|uniref:hypothetical protein n=1 Tax=Streptomyces sp. NPDC006259 TaxID=3364740 RepID=UPI0036BB636B